MLLKTLAEGARLLRAARVMGITINNGIIGIITCMMVGLNL